MDVVFMGTPEFAVPSLRMLAAAHTVRAVYTRPDAVSGRGNVRVAPPVKMVAEKLGLPVVQPDSLRDTVQVARLAALSPDVICVAAYGMLLPPDVLKIPRFGCVNVHASLLPAYRGAAPIHRALLAGEREVGVSIMAMEEGLDTGAYALQRSVPAEDRSIEELTDVLAETGAEALIEALSRLERGDLIWTPQDDALATYAPKITRDDVALHPGLSVQDALSRVRVSSRRAPSRLDVGGTVLTVVAASRSTIDVAPGIVGTSGSSLVVGLRDGSMRLDIIRPAGKADMTGAAWLCGARLNAGCSWEAAS